MDTYTAGYLQAVMNAQREVVGASILEESLTEDILNRLRKVCPMKKEEDEWESDAWLYANYFLARKLTAQERTDLLQRLAQEQEVKLYTPEETNLPGVTNCGPVEYLTEMPLVFKHSKINLNITLRSIRTGIPLRAMDIMGCGGFLLTNFQEDFLCVKTVRAIITSPRPFTIPAISCISATPTAPWLPMPWPATSGSRATTSSS